MISVLGRRLRALGRTQDGRVGLSILGGLAAVCFVVGPFLPDPNLSDFTIPPSAVDGGPPGPSGAHPLGVDPLYRDELARLAAGGRISLLIAVAATTLATLVGLVVGVGAATAKRLGAGWADGALMRFTDIMLAFPFLLLVTLVGVLAQRTDVTTIVIVLGLTGWTGLARVVRARAATVLEQDFVLGARAMGASALRIGVRHVLPNVAPTALAFAAALAGSMILAEAVLSYLTVGLSPPDASWGRMLHEAESFVVTRPSLVALPGVCVVLALLGFHRLGEALQPSREEQGPIARIPFALDVALVTAAFVGLLALPRTTLAPPGRSVALAGPVSGGTLRLATMYSARTLDPAVASDEMGIALGRMMFGKLIDLDERGQFVPGLSERMEWADGGLTLRLQLRAGVRFQDGAELTAVDVKRSIERALSPRVPSPAASHFASIAGLEAYRAQKADHISGVEALGDHTVVFRLTEPDSSLPSLLSTSFVAPVCPSTPFEVARTTEATLCGAGPFRIASFESEQGAKLVKHAEFYLPDRPHLDAVEVMFRVRPQVQRYRFERGELDLVRELSSTDAGLFLADSRYEELVHVVKNMRVSAIFMNTERAPFENVSLRRAVSFAIDPSVLARLRPDLAQLTTVIPEGVPGRPKASAGRTHDLKRALAAMEAAGYPYNPETGEGGYPDVIEYVTIPDSLEQAAAEIYQQQLARVGLRVKLRLISSLSYLTITQRRAATTMGWAGWQADYPDPLTFFDPNLVSWSVGDVTQNYSFFVNDELDRVVKAARRETDFDKRAALFGEAEAIVATEAPWVPTTTPSTIEVRQPWLRGYEPTSLSTLDFTNAFLARERP